MQSTPITDLRFGTIPGTQALGFYHESTGTRVGPAPTNIVSAAYLLNSFIREHKMNREQALTLAESIRTAYPANAEATVQPELEFVRTPGGQKGAFILTDVKLKVGAGFVNKRAALAELNALVTSKRINADAVPTLTAQIDTVFAAIVADTPAPSHQFVRTRSGHRGVFLNKKGETKSSPLRTASHAHEVVNSGCERNLIHESDILALQQQIEAVFSAINAERTVRFEICFCGYCGGDFINTQTGELMTSLPGGPSYDDEESAMRVMDQLYADQKISEREATWLSEEIMSTFATVAANQAPQKMEMTGGVYVRFI